MKNRKVGVTLKMPVWQVFAKAAKERGMRVSKFMELAAREHGSVVAIVAELKRPLPQMDLSGRLPASPTGMPARVMKLLQKSGPLLFIEIVNKLEPSRNERDERQRIRNATLRLVKTGKLSMTEDRLVSLRKE